MEIECMFLTETQWWHPFSETHSVVTVERWWLPICRLTFQTKKRQSQPLDLRSDARSLSTSFTGTCTSTWTFACRGYSKRIETFARQLRTKMTSYISKLSYSNWSKLPLLIKTLMARQINLAWMKVIIMSMQQLRCRMRFSSLTVAHRVWLLVQDKTATLIIMLYLNSSRLKIVYHQLLRHSNTTRKRSTLWWLMKTISLCINYSACNLRQVLPKMHNQREVPTKTMVT